MTIYVDTANPKEAEQWVKESFISGITTNPLLLAELRVTDRFAHLQKLSNMLMKEQKLMVQAVGNTPDKLLEDARTLHEMLPKAVIKIPADANGFAIAPTLVHDDIELCFTAVFSAAQGIIGAFAGGHFIAPYIGRMRDAKMDAWAHVEDMVDAFEAHELDAHVLAASLRTPEDVAQALALGCHVTVKPAILKECYTPKYTEEIVKEFNTAHSQLLRHSE